jgi:PAS domain S-box-containing protein
MSELSPYKNLEDAVKTFENVILSSFESVDSRLTTLEKNNETAATNRETELRNYERSLKQLAIAAKGFAELPKYGDIYQYTGEQLSRLTDDSFVIISAFDRSLSSVLIKSMTGSESFREALAEKLGKPAGDIMLELPDTAAMNLMSGTLMRHDTERAAGILPQHIYKELSDLLQIKAVYEIGITCEEELLGDAIIFSHKQLGERHDIIESFVLQAALTLKRKKSEERLREDNEFLSLTLNSITEPVIITNKAGYVFYMNAGAEEISGWQKANAKGRHFRDIIKLYHSITAQNSELRTQNSELLIENAFDSAVRNGKISELNDNVKVRSKTGKDTVVSPAVTVLRPEKGEILGYAFVFKEGKSHQSTVISPQTKEPEKPEETQNPELKTQNLKEEKKLSMGYFAFLAHELRSPLNAVIGFSDILAADIKDKAQGEYVNIIRSCSNDILRLTNDILDFAKLDAGKAAINKTDFNIIDIFKELYDTYSGILRTNDKAGIQLRMNKAGFADKLIINSDPDRIKQIFRNLLGNAVKFTKEGHIEFGIWLPEENNTLKLFVKDTGQGIPADRHKAVFEAYEQTEGTKYQGTGLGLSISKRLTELLGGKMWLESSPGKGSTFFFTLPVNIDISHIEAEEHADIIEPPVIAAPEVKSKYDWRDKIILIAEDIESHRKLIEGLLKRTKATCLIAHDGKEAIEICRKNEHIDLVLMDIQLPGTDGYMATKEIKKLRNDLPVIAVTAFGMPNGKEEITRNRLDGFLEKPFKTEDLLEIIYEHINLVRTKK